MQEHQGVLPLRKANSSIRQFGAPTLTAASSVSAKLLVIRGMRTNALEPGQVAKLQKSTEITADLTHSLVKTTLQTHTRGSC